MTKFQRGVFRVLVVDDNPADQRLAAIHLGAVWPLAHDLELDCAADGQEALLQLRRKQFTLVVLDWTLPVLGHGEVLRQLRRRGIRIPVVVVSGLDRAEIEDNLDELAAAYLRKDLLSAATLRHAIARSLALLGTPEPQRYLRELPAHPVDAVVFAGSAT